jgi:hypothetical protein
MMKNTTLFGISAAVLLAGCMSTEQAQQQSYVGQQNGQQVYQFTTSRASGAWSEQKLNRAINVQASRRCPNGYRELNRQDGSSRWVPGAIPIKYTDVVVTVVCG